VTREQKIGSRRQICRAYLVPPESSRPGDEEGLSGRRPYHLSAKRSECVRRTFSTSHGLNGLRFAPCHANAFSEDCGEIRRHVRDRRMCVGIEDLWRRYRWYRSGTWGTRRTHFICDFYRSRDATIRRTLLTSPSEVRYERYLHQEPCADNGQERCSVAFTIEQGDRELTCGAPAYA
jgi:hypothetical protein